MPTWNSKSTAEEAALAFQSEIRGKNVLVTGVSPTSLGAETVRVLAPYAQTIILASRTKSKIEETIAIVKAENPVASFKVVVLDLASIASIKTAAAEVNALGIPIHVVIENAAVVQYRTLTRTADGFEGQFGANHLGHFLFTGLILPSVRRAIHDIPGFPPRIVVVGSEAHAYPGGAIRFDDPNFEKRPEEYSKFHGYAPSKTANILFTRLLAKKLAPEGIVALTLHPGNILDTGMGQAASQAELEALGLVDDDGKILDPEIWKTIPEGTATQIITAFDPSLKDKSGAYLVDGNVANDKLMDYASDDEIAERLWTLMNASPAVGLALANCSMYVSMST